MNKEKQVVYIFMDDSGKMSHIDKCCSYKCVYFKNRFDRDNFKRHYIDIIKTNNVDFAIMIKNVVVNNALLEKL